MIYNRYLFLGFIFCVALNYSLLLAAQHNNLRAQNLKKNFLTIYRFHTGLQLTQRTQGDVMLRGKVCMLFLLYAAANKLTCAEKPRIEVAQFTYMGKQLHPTQLQLTCPVTEEKRRNIIYTFLSSAEFQTQVQKIIAHEVAVTRDELQPKVDTQAQEIVELKQQLELDKLLLSSFSAQWLPFPLHLKRAKQTFLIQPR